MMTARTMLLLPLACGLCLSACAARRAVHGGPVDSTAPSSSLQLESSAFTAQDPLPMRYTCDGDEVSPPLHWSHAPAGTRSLVLIVDDAEQGDVSTHWLLYDLPPTGELHEGVQSKRLPPGTKEALGDGQTTAWRGPCPTSGRHQYHFKIFALDTALPYLSAPTRLQVETAMQGHILATGELVGTYERQSTE